MKFGFKLGKSKEKAPPEEAAVEEEAGVETVDELLQSVEPTAVKPHAPLQELSLDGEPEVEVAAEEAILPEDGAGEGEGETVKLVEVKASPTAAVPPPPPPTPVSPPVKKDAGGKPADPLDISASINSIFTDVEEEENPLDNLIKTLPEVAATELIDDLNEISDIIKDWKKR